MQSNDAPDPTFSDYRRKIIQTRLAPERWLQLQGGWKVFFCVPCKKIFYRVTLKNIKNAEFSEYSVKKMNIFGLILGCFFG